MAGEMSVRRLKREYQSLVKSPVDNIEAAPLETNILEWHYVLRGTSGTPYEGGFYHGLLKFPPQYPWKPPSVIMLTPSGRFKPNRKLCLSMSDFHPESWNPMWSVSTILTGLYSFMLESAPTSGSMEASPAQRRKYAAQSLEFNCKDKNFCALFPHYVDLFRERQQQGPSAGPGPGTGAGPGGGTVDGRAAAAHGSGVAGGRTGGATVGAVVGKEQEPGPAVVMVSVCISLVLLAVILKLFSA